MKRKSFIANSAAALAAGMLPFSNSRAASNKVNFTIAFMSDVHVLPGSIPEKGLANALQHINQHKNKIDFIVNGGDAIMDSLNASKEYTAEQWSLFKKILQENNQLPIYHTIGNHDIWGWFLPDPKPLTDPLFAKNWVVETLKMPKRFYSFKHKSWKFIVLDSTQQNPKGGYIARLDEEQMSWLKQELAATPANEFICLISHIPLLSICAGLYFNKTEENGDLKIQRNLMHTDFLDLQKLFSGFKNIKACLSGHIHMQDEIHYFGIPYYCNGAVCGNWWKGAFNNFEPAYALFDFFTDGTVKRTMINYS